MNSWETLTSLDLPRCHAGLVTIHGRLYLVGGRAPKDAAGRSGVVSVDSIERYNKQMDHWQAIAKLRTARHDASCAAVGQSVSRSQTLFTVSTVYLQLCCAAIPSSSSSCLSIRTRKLSYRKDDRAMRHRPMYGCSENFREPLTHGYFSRNFSWAFVPIEPMNAHAKFEFCSFTRS